MTTWHWVRHGPTHEKAFVGWRDVPADLSDTAQIERLHAFLPDDALLISSDLQRSVTTADVLDIGRTRLPHHADLREFRGELPSFAPAPKPGALLLPWPRPMLAIGYCAWLSLPVPHCGNWLTDFRIA